MVFDLRQFVKDKLDKLDMPQKELANKIGYTSISKFLNVDKTSKKDKNKELTNFDALVKMVRLLAPDEEYTIMDKYCRTLEPNNKSARMALEYALLNRLYDLLEYLIENLKNSNEINKEWACAYEIYKKVLMGEISYTDSIDMAARLKTDTVEIRVFVKLIQFHSYYNLNSLEIIPGLIVGLEEKINDIKDIFIRNSYMGRLAINMINVCLHKNDIPEARRFAINSLKNDNQLVIDALIKFRLGDTYLYENYEEGIRMLHLAKDIYQNLEGKEQLLKQVSRSINFMQNYWYQEPEYLDRSSNEISDVHEICFNLIRNNRCDEAINILNRIKKANLSDYQKGFHYFYRGLISKNNEEFYKSVAHFKLSGDSFYRKLPLIELKKLGENESVLYALSV